MYSTSSQKREWTFTPDQLVEMRIKANQASRENKMKFANEEEADLFLSVEEELLLTQIVERAAVRFSDTFNPPMWPSVRWTAYMYYKRLYLDWSAMDAMPKIVMMACFYLAMKTDEFFVTIEEFCGNLTSGSSEQNATKILGLEPEIMRALRYQLTVHCPYRPFEGHLMEMKTKMLLLNFDLEILRRPADEFFKKCLYGDAMLVYPPSQLALAAIKHGLQCEGKSDDVLRDFVYKLMGVTDDWTAGDQSQCIAVADKLLVRLDEIVAFVAGGAREIQQGAQQNLLARASKLAEFQMVLEQRRQARGIEKKREDPIDSDDD